MKHDNDRGISAYFIKNPVAANLLMVVILAVGILTAGGLRKEIISATEPNMITVSVDYESGSARQVEEGVAVKIEEAVKGLDGVKKVTSSSGGSGATVDITKTSGQKLEPLFNEVKTRVDAITGFPAAAKKPVITKATWEDHVLWIQVYGDADPKTLQSLGTRLRQDLLRKSGISKVNLAGERNPMISIEVSDATLESYGLTLSDVAEAVGRESLVSTSGELRSAEGITKLKAARQWYTAADFERLVLISRSDGSQVRLGDIASVRDMFAETPAVLSRFQGEPAMGLKLVATRSGDIVTIAEQAREVMDDWRSRRLLPRGVRLAAWFDQSTHIEQRLSLLFKNALFGVVLIFIVLSLTLNMKVAFFVALGIPVSIAGTLMMMGKSCLDISINELSTFGFILALGILVDDAVVIAESIYSTRQAEGDTLASTVRGVHKVSVPTVFGVLTTIAAFYPLSMIEGEMGQIFASFSMIVAVCLFFSLIESKWILPAHLAHVNTRGAEPLNVVSRIWNRVRNFVDAGIRLLTFRIYKPLLRRVVGHRYAVAVLFVSLLVVVAGVVKSGRVKSVFFPEIPGKVVTASFSLSEETGYGLAFSHAGNLEQKALELNRRLMDEHRLNIPVILNVQTLVSAATEGRVIIELNPSKEVPVTTGEVTRAWRSAAGNLEGCLSLEFSFGWEGAEDLYLELYSGDPSQLADAAGMLREALSLAGGVYDVKDNLKPEKPQVELVLKPEGRAVGLTTRSLANLIQQGFYGYEVQTFQRDGREVKVKVRFPKDERRSVGDLLDTRIRLSTGKVVPVSYVARLESGFTVSDITRQDGMRSVYVTARVDKKITSPGGVIDRLNERVLPDILRDHPLVSIGYGGEEEEEATTTRSLKKLFGMTLLVIYILLAIPLASYAQPLLIMSAIPFGLVGAVLGHWINGIPLSLLSFLGMLALSGVMVNDSLLLVSRYNQLKGEGMGTAEAILEAGPGRLRAILLTSLTTYIGLAPLLKETSEQAQFLIPAAVSLAYGVLFGTLITLVLIPVLIYIREDLILLKGFLRNDRAQEKMEVSV